MRAVADEEHAAFPVPRRDLRRHRPRADVAHGEVDVCRTDGASYDRGAGLLGERLDRLGVRVVRVHEDPRAIDVVRDEDAGARGVDHPVEDRRPVAHERAQVRLEVDHHEALQPVGADHLDPERLPDATAGAIRCEQPVAAHLVLALPLEVAHAGRHAVSLLLERGPFVAVADDRPVEMLQEQRLESMLGEVQERRRRVFEGVVSLPLVRQSTELGSGQGGHPGDV